MNFRFGGPLHELSHCAHRPFYSLDSHCCWISGEVTFACTSICIVFASVGVIGSAAKLAIGDRSRRE